MTVICKALRDQIEHGLLKPGGRLPAERRLSELFATTRITLREALAQLEAQGLIYREERRGWFVSPPPLIYDLLSRSGFEAKTRAQGREARVRLISANSMPASAQICEKLQLPALSSVIRVCYAGAIDGRWVLYGERYLNPIGVPDTAQCDFHRLEPFFSDHGMEFGEARIEMRYAALHGEACSALKVGAGTPALCIVRLNFARHGGGIACDMEYWRHDALRVSALIPDGEAGDEDLSPGLHR
jgi:DNA-binding GntR family transcriptional regulator